MKAKTTSNKAKIKVTLTLTPGPLTPAQLEAKRKFWQKISEKVHKSEIGILLTSIVLAAFLGFALARGTMPVIATPAPEIVKEYIPVYETVEKSMPYPVYQEIVSERMITKTETVEVAKQPKEFASIENLMAWYGKNAGRINSQPDWDCADWAAAYQILAFKDGYLLSIFPVDNGHIFGIVIPGINRPHVGNGAVIGKDIWYIESVPNVGDGISLRNYIKIANRT